MSSCVSGDMACTSITSIEQNLSPPHPYITLGGSSSVHDVVSQVVPLEDTEQHQYPGHVHLEDNSVVYALANRTAGFG